VTQPDFSAIATVCHLARSVEWAGYQQSGLISPPSLRSEGFVHCSTLEQSTTTIDRYFVGVDDLLIVTLDVAALGPGLRWEESHPGEWFPHVYGPIPMAAVIEVTPVAA
jgi:uncharacterized protein (DUF952 family)